MDEQWVRFVAEVNRHCSVGSRDCAGVTHFSRIPGKRFRDADKLPKTMVAFDLLAQSILNNQGRAVVVEVCQPLLLAQSSLSAIKINLHVNLHRYNTAVNFVKKYILLVYCCTEMDYQARHDCLTLIHRHLLHAANLQDDADFRLDSDHRLRLVQAKR